MNSIFVFVLLCNYSLEISSFCGRCHEEIYANFITSSHFLSAKREEFLNSLMKWGFKKEDKKFCLECHAPLVRVNSDFDLEEELTREGVNCEFCHSIKGIDDSEFILDPGWFKYSLYARKTKSHGTRISKIFRDSKMCGVCHEVQNRHKLKVISTYSEYLNSGDKRTCQDCHFHGEDKIEFLSLMLRREKKDEETKIILNLKNHIPHSIPAGSPRKILTLRILLSSDEKEVQEEFFEFKRVIGDSSNRIISPESSFLKFFEDGFFDVEDTRLKGLEGREEVIGIYPFPLSHFQARVEIFLVSPEGKNITCILQLHEEKEIKCSPPPYLRIH